MKKACLRPSAIVTCGIKTTIFIGAFGRTTISHNLIRDIHAFHQTAYLNQQVY